MQQEIVTVNEIRIDVLVLNESKKANTAIVKQLPQAQGDLENKRRSNNLLFFGLPDRDGETWADSEFKKIDLTSLRFGIPL